MSQFRTILTLLLVSLPTAAAFSQTGPPSGPSLVEPAQAMQVTDTEMSIELRDEALAAYQDVAEAVAQYEQARNENRLKSIKPAPITNTYKRLFDLQWFSLRLKIRGEPAGHDFMNRRDQLNARLLKIIEAYKGLPGVLGNLRQVGVRQAQGIARKNDGQRKSAQQLANKKEFIEADDKLHSPLREVYSFSVWYNVGKKTANLSAYVKPFATTRQAVERGAAEDRTVVANDTFLELRASIVPDLAGLQAQLDSAIAEAGSSGRIDGQTGPQWLVNFGQKWQEAQINAMRSMGLDMARHSQDSRDAAAAFNELVADQHLSTDATIAGIPRLISADAARATPAEALDLYYDYLSALAPLVALTGDSELAMSVQPALNQMAQKSPALQGDVEVYRRVTGDLLRWRERVAQSYTMSQASAYPALTAEFKRAAKTSKKAEETLLPTMAINRSGETAVLSGPGPVAATYIGELLRNKDVHASSMISARDGSGHTTSLEQTSVYARSMPIDFSPAVANLRSALLVTGDALPLTLEAAVALETASRGDHMTVGGKITDIVIEGLTGRLANVSAADWGMVRLGKVRAYNKFTTLDDRFLPFVVVRAELEPKWWRHKYFYFEL